MKTPRAAGKPGSLSLVMIFAPSTLARVTTLSSRRMGEPKPLSTTAPAETGSPIWSSTPSTSTVNVPVSQPQ